MRTTTVLATVAVAATAAVGGAAVSDRLSPSEPSPRPQAATPATPGATPSNVSENTSARQVYDGAKDSIAYIAVAGQQGQGAGSGFVVSEDGLIVTNAHVVDGAVQIGVKLGTEDRMREARLVASAPSKDLALLKVDADGLRPLALAGGANVGDDVYAIGSPFGLDQTLTTGVVSALDRTIQAPDGSPIAGAIQTDAAINPGNSGGPLLNGDGAVIGVNSQIASQSGGSTGVGFAVAAADVKAFLDAAKNGGAQPQQTAPYGSSTPYGGPSDQDGGPSGRGPENSSDPLADLFS